MTISQLSAFRISSLEAQAEAHFWGPALKALVSRQSQRQTVTHFMDQNVRFCPCGVCVVGACMTVHAPVCVCMAMVAHQCVCLWMCARANQ